MKSYHLTYRAQHQGAINGQRYIHSPGDQSILPVDYAAARRVYANGLPNNPEALRVLATATAGPNSRIRGI